MADRPTYEQLAKRVSSAARCGTWSAANGSKRESSPDSTVAWKEKRSPSGCGSISRAWATASWRPPILLLGVKTGLSSWSHVTSPRPRTFRSSCSSPRKWKPSEPWRSGSAADLQAASRPHQSGHFGFGYAGPWRRRYPHSAQSRPSGHQGIAVERLQPQRRFQRYRQKRLRRFYSETVRPERTVTKNQWHHIVSARLTPMRHGRMLKTHMEI